MDVLSILALIAVIAAVGAFVSAPLRARDAGSPGPEGERADLDAQREAKYREIRDAEMDYRTGKLSAADYRALDVSLRAEAMEILHQLDVVDPEPR